MAMNENENKTAVPTGTPKNSGRYPWVEDDGLKALSEMDTTLIDLDDQLRGVLEDIQYYFGHYGSGEDKSIIGDLDHAIELLIPRLGYQKALIRSQYNKKTTQLNELAIAYAQICDKNAKLEEDCKRHVDDCCNTAQLCTKLQTELKNEQDRAESDRAYLKKQITALHLHNCQLHDECNDLQKKLNVAMSDLGDMKESVKCSRNLYLRECDKTEKLAEQVDEREERICKLEAKVSDQGKIYSQLLNQNKYLKAEAADNAFQANQLREENERLTVKVKEAEETNIKLVAKNYELETRVHKLESEYDDGHDYDEMYSDGYDEGFDDGIESMYDALLTMMGIINVDDFEEVFHISETATDKEIIEYFRQMHPRVFMEACKRYEEHEIDKIKVGDEVQYISGWRMIVTEVKDNWYKGIIRLSQSPTNIRKDQCRKTGNHYSSIPFSYDGRMAIDDENDEDEEF